MFSDYCIHTYDSAIQVKYLKTFPPLIYYIIVVVKKCHCRRIICDLYFK